MRLPSTILLLIVVRALQRPRSPVRPTDLDKKDAPPPWRLPRWVASVPVGLLKEWTSSHLVTPGIVGSAIGIKRSVDGGVESLVGDRGVGSLKKSIDGGVGTLKESVGTLKESIDEAKVTLVLIAAAILSVALVQWNRSPSLPSRTS